MERETKLGAAGMRFNTIFGEKSSSFVFEKDESYDHKLKELWFTSSDIGEIYNVRSQFIEKEIDTIFSKCEITEETSSKLFPAFEEKKQDEIVDRVRYVNLEVALLVGLKVDTPFATCVSESFLEWLEEKNEELNSLVLMSDRVQQNILNEYAKAKNREI